jgi:hypothetical protein
VLSRVARWESAAASVIDTERIDTGVTEHGDGSCLWESALKVAVLLSLLQIWTSDIIFYRDVNLFRVKRFT